jgi:transcriptional regulator with XRE-family HTH domain
MSGTPRPWFELVDELRAQTRMSQDDLAYSARQHGAPSTLTGSWISQLKLGKRPLAIDILEGMAGALGVDPNIFVEYRLAIARRALDEKEVGLPQAAATLTALGDVVAGVPGPPPGELAQLLQDAAPSSRDRARSGSSASRKSGRRPRSA